MKVLSKIMAVICVLIIGVATVGCSAIQYAKIGETSKVVAKAYTILVSKAERQDNNLVLTATIKRSGVKSDELEITASCFTVQKNTTFNWKTYKASEIETFTLKAEESKEICLIFENIIQKDFEKKLYLEFDLSDKTLGTFVELGVVSGTN